MQQGGRGGGGGGGGGGSQSQYGEMSGVGGPTTTAGLTSTHMVDQSQQQLVEAASPISSRPPATGNLDEFIRLSGGGDEDALGAAGEEGDRAGVSSSNRWPRQETLALLKIRSDMDAVFRDATVKGPLWEDVSRKLAELGYQRSAKKCKEKFENVHKYYKRTKEGRAGRQDGKSYKFFSELEALHSSSAAAAATPANNVSMSVTPATAATTLDVAPVSVGIPMPISSARIPPNPSQPISTVPISSSIFIMPSQPAPGSASAPAPQAPPVYTSTAAQFGISFSSDSSSSSEGSDDEDDDEEEAGGEPSSAAGGSRKRKRQSSRGGGGSGNTRRMMQFFEGLMKQVMHKQEAMQQRFLEAIEKREQDRMIREEAWKRQELARLTREHELMAQERAVAASRDSAIVSFLQKITGQTVQLPTTVAVPTFTVMPPPTQPAQVITLAAPISTAAPPQHQPPIIPQQTPPPQQQQQLHYQQQQQHRSQSSDVVRHQAPVSSEVVMAIPEQTVPPQDIGGGGSSEPTSSRWPKPEVLALIKLRSGLESRYQEAGPKGPLWEEISAGMLQMGCKRSAKRCKEKWENINKYFKKVKESNKKRPEDAKTCPYFHELDALYRKKILGSSSGSGGASSSSFTGQQRPEEQTSEQHQQESIQVAQAPVIMAAPQPTQTGESENKGGDGAGDSQTGKEGVPGSLFGEGNGGATKTPEDIMRELMEQRGIQQQQHQQPGQPLAVEDYEKMGDPDSDVMDEDEDEDENEEDEEELEEDRKMSYKIDFERSNTGPSNGGKNGAPSFLTMVQ